jgi:hypothetical protein
MIWMPDIPHLRRNNLGSCWIARPIAPSLTSSPARIVAPFSSRSLYAIE